MDLPQLRRLLLLGSGLLIAVYLGLAFGTAPSRDRVQVILPFWVHHLPTAGFILFLLSQLAAVATRRGWRRLTPLLSLGLAFPLFVVVIGFVQVATVRSEIDRVSLPSGRVVMMTIGPGITDTIFGLWEKAGWWCWQTPFEAASDITYSEDHSFTSNPRLVVTADGRYLLIRRGGIWTDCWAIVTGLNSCLPGEQNSPDKREDWIDRSERIAGIVGADPSSP
ncbi:hypothetical protein [Methylobacterium trifolii]|uniref:hypothetical protein n=1 Tax=Methylobacterium trifolii TaxID=1003092 RepID=UPI001EDEC46F|nr:hypothetical protein [Methylobacterium trifolii]